MPAKCLDCQICGKEFDIKEDERWAGGNCPNCGQRYDYDNDCYRISLTKEQLQVLRSYARLTKTEIE